MNPIKVIFGVIAAIGNVLIKVCSAAERGATALDELAKAGETKAKNFSALVEFEDNAAFTEERNRIKKRLQQAGITVNDNGEEMKTINAPVASQASLKL